MKFNVSTPAVLVSDADPEYMEVVSGISITRGKVATFTLGDMKEKVISLDGETDTSRPGRIIFSSEGVLYKLRALREEDGFYLSKYSILLPVSVLEGLTKNKKGSFVENETLFAYAVDGSPYVAALVYKNDRSGAWIRVSGEWISLAPGAENIEGMSSIPIDPAKAEDFIEMYDNNYVSLEDIGEYEEGDAE
jgi:hypothetical protein